jgi:hypothetical protein
VPRTLGFIFAAVGTGTLVAGVVVLVWSWLFYLKGGRVEGTVTDMAHSNSRGSRNSSAPIVTYEVEGRTYTYRSSVYSSPPSYRVGDKVTLLYRPENPASALIHSFLEEWGLALLLTALGATFAYIGFAMVSWRPIPAAPDWKG